MSMPQIGVEPMDADPNFCQSYHQVMNIAWMDGSVRRISAVSQTAWNGMLDPADGQVLPIE